MKKPKIVFFDYGQTLIDETSFDLMKGIQAVLETAVENPKNVPPKEIADFFGRMLQDINLPTKDFTGMQYIEVPDPMMQEYLFRFFGLRPVKSSREIEWMFWNRTKTSKPSPGITDVLAFLRENGIRTGVISNTPITEEILAKSLKKLIPENSFDPIVTSSETIFRKPHPRIFQYALQRAGLPASEAVHCGDNPMCDVEGASAAGIFPVWYKGCCTVAENIQPKCKHLAIQSWRELKDKISRISETSETQK
jgi:putative hydrolase of the HAD superfamily